MKKGNPNLENAVIDIDEVEYIINKDAAKSILLNEKTVILKRLVDQKKVIMSLKEVRKSILDNGIIDTLDN